MKFIIKLIAGLYIFIGLILVVISFPPESFSEALMTIFVWPYYVLGGFAAANLL